MEKTMKLRKTESRRRRGDTQKASTTEQKSGIQKMYFIKTLKIKLLAMFTTTSSAKKNVSLTLMEFS